MQSKVIRQVMGPRKRLSIGIDPSLVGFAMAAIVDGTLNHAVGWTDKVTLQRDNPDDLCFFKSLKSSPTSRQSRISIVANWCLNEIYRLIGALGCIKVDTCVALEGYAFSQHSVGNSDIHELCGVVKTNLWEHGIPMRVYTPNEVKLAFAGHGFASKTDMLVACFNHHHKDYTKLGSAADNLADAVGIAHLLDAERKYKLELISEGDLEPEERKVLFRATKANPVPLRARAFIHRDEVEHNDPVFAREKKI